MKRKRKNMAKRETAKTNNDEFYYKNFVIPCVIFFCRIFNYKMKNMRIDKQITICKLGTEMKIYPESKNEIGLWIAHPPCFVISANDLYGVENIVKNAIRYSNSGEFANEDSAKLVLREFRLKSWNVLYKTYKIISFSLTSEQIIITPYIYTRRGGFPDNKKKLIFDKSDYSFAIRELLKY